MSVLAQTTKAPDFDAKLTNITKGLRKEIFDGLTSIPKENASVIIEYILAMFTEVNPSDSYRRDNIRLLCSFSRYYRTKPFKSITREEVISFLNATEA
jgi:hypothetical protein